MTLTLIPISNISPRGSVAKLKIVCLFLACSKMEAVPVKICSRCRETKPSIEFYHSSTARDSLTSACRDCVKARNKAKLLIRRDFIASHLNPETLPMPKTEVALAGYCRYCGTDTEGTQCYECALYRKKLQPSITCNRCGVSKPVTDFPPSKNTCRECLKKKRTPLSPVPEAETTPT